MRGSRGAAMAEAPSLFDVGGMVTCVLMTPLSRPHFTTPYGVAVRRL